MKQQNAKQKKWMKDIAEWASDNIGLLYPGYDNTPFHLHHALGRSAKHNKVAIGHEFILPIPIELHDVSSNHPLNVTYYKKRFAEEYGSQSGMYKIMFSAMDYEGYTVPDMGIYHAIMDTNA